MKSHIVSILLLFLIVFITPSIQAQGFVECDACGYCYASGQAPGNWENCRTCLYPQARTTPALRDTLVKKPNPTTKLIEQVTKVPGKYYTQLGCIDTGLSSFTDPTAAGGVLNFLLTRLIFPTVGALSFLSLIYGAFLLITAQSDPERIAKGKSYVVGAIVGLIFTLSVILIINTIASDVLRIPGFTRPPQAFLAIKGDTLINARTQVKPVLRVTYGNNVQDITIEGGTQDIKIDLPIAPNQLNKPEVLNAIIFSMKEDLCYSMATNDRALCCDCAQDESAIQPQYRESWRNKCSTRPLSSTRIAQCKDRANYSGDINLHINQLTINGKKCTGYTLNNTPQSKTPIIMSSINQEVRCSSIES